MSKNSQAQTLLESKLSFALFTLFNSTIITQYQSANGNNFFRKIAFTKWSGTGSHFEVSDIRKGTPQKGCPSFHRNIWISSYLSVPLIFLLQSSLKCFPYSENQHEKHLSSKKRVYFDWLKMSKNSFAVTINGLLGKCLMFPVIR